MSIQQLIERMPKAELHLHLDGSSRPSTIIELARAQKIALPTEDEQELTQILMPGENCQSLEEYLQAFGITCSVMGTREALYRIAYELVEDCARDQHRYFEVRWATRVLPQTMAPREMVEAVWNGLRDAGERYGVVARQILCGMRHEDPQHGIDTATLAAQCKDLGVVAYDIAGAEAPFPPSLHVESFQIAANAQLRTTCHAGEAAGAAFVQEAIVQAGAERIGHGTRLEEDAALLQYVVDREIPIEICLTSNVQTKATSAFEAHPLRRYLDAGAKIVLCTDNRTVSGVSLQDEFERAHRIHGLTVDELRQLTHNAFDSAFLPRAERIALRDEALREFDALRQELQL